MKIGVITFYCSHNYGAMLQAYALKEYLKLKGHESYVIDFKPKYKLVAYKKGSARYWLSRNPMMCLKRLYHYIRSKKRRNARWNRFDRFMKSNLSLYPYHVGMDFHEFDAILIGSDQVWSPYHTGGNYDKIMFGEGFKCKAISYAASCTSMTLSDAQKAFLQTHLSNLSAISVREEKFKDLLQPLTPHDIEVVLDPTLLVGAEVFSRLAASVNRKKPYVVIYEIIRHEELHTLANDIARQLNADIVELTNSVSNAHNDPSVDDEASPDLFLGYMKEAACIVTTSFHGTAFAILFQKPFYVMKQGTVADNRMSHLLQSIGLQDRMLEKGHHPTFSIPDYTMPNKKLNELVRKSEAFIQNSIVSSQD